MPPSATLFVGPDQYPLDAEDPVIVPAGPVIVEIEEAPGPHAVRLDGRKPRMAWTQTARRVTLALDLKRDTGFHELIVGPAAFLFGTDDAKLRIDGVIGLLDYLAAEGLSWSGAMFFSGTEQVLRDLRLDRAWLERRAPEILRLGAAVADRPWTVRRS